MLKVEQQVPPLRFAPVGMTILLEIHKFLRGQLCLRNKFVIPTGANRNRERVEGPAVHCSSDRCRWKRQPETTSRGIGP